MTDTTIQSTNVYQPQPLIHTDEASRKRAVLGPNNEDLAAKRELFNAGPCWVKMLVTDKVAGSIIGKAGSVITDLERSTGCIIKLSPGRTYFPGTQERLVVISGTLESVFNAVKEVVEKVKLATIVEEHRKDPTCPIDVDITCKIIVPNSAVSCIIGRGGEVVREINKNTGALIRASERFPGLHERMVQMSGSQHEVLSAAREVVTRIQSDRNLREHLNVVYSNSPQQVSSPAGSAYTPTSPTPPSLTQYPTQLMAFPCSVAFEVDDSLVGGIIGRGGSVLHGIASQTGATVTLSHREVSDTGGGLKRTVRISGSLAAVQQAHLLVVKQIFEASSPSSPRP